VIRKPPPGRSLADVESHLAAEWHPTLNGDLTPADVLPGSQAKVWWRCPKCQREYQARVFKRTQGQGCRECGIARRTAHQARPAPGQSLAELLPQVAAEWHPDLNGDMSPADVKAGSGTRAWWRCAGCGFDWEAPVHRRAQGTGCPKCASVGRGILRATPTLGRSFGDLHPDVTAEWHPTRNADLKPTDVKPASRKRVWWQCSEGHEWQVGPADRQRGEQCPFCAERIRSLKKSTPEPERSLADLHPEIAAEWHPTKNAPLTAADVNPGAKQKRWWKCRTCGHDWETDPDHRTRSRRGCPKCGYRQVSRTKSTPRPGESLAEKNPQLAAEWHPTENGSVTPFDVRPRGRAKTWWQCRFGHEWYAPVAPRVEGVGCPHCSIVGISQRQVRLEYELAAAGLPVEHGHPPIVVTGRRRPIKADIAMPDIRLVVEYDGSYYHAGKVRADREQTALLESAGWTVVRVRELPLPELGGHEILVLPTQSIKSLTIKVLRGLARIGYSASEMSAYTTDSRLWAEREANEALYKYRAKSLASEFPDVAAEFHKEKNGGITPDQVHPGSQTKFWWQCGACGFEWYTAVHIRTAGHGCPVRQPARGTAARGAACRGVLRGSVPGTGEGMASDAQRHADRQSSTTRERKNCLVAVRARARMGGQSQRPEKIRSMQAVPRARAPCSFARLVNAGWAVLPLGAGLFQFSWGMYSP
jgi:predicted  nucleic acid-binding Zn-ribbon protein